jgi:LETM1 and EF-hand domain-containing protein 1
MIWSHRKRVNEIEARVKAGGEPLSRWEARFIETYRIDVKKYVSPYTQGALHSNLTIRLIPFLLILAVIEEIIPLVVLYAPFMLPSTCVLPSQRERILLKQRERIEKVAETARPDFKQVLQQGDATVPVGSLISGSQLVAMCGYVHSMLYEFYVLIPIRSILSLSTYGLPALRLNRIKRHLERIAEDDTRLIQEGKDQRLTLPELQEALDERGLYVELFFASGTHADVSVVSLMVFNEMGCNLD